MRRISLTPNDWRNGSAKFYFPVHDADNDIHNRLKFDDLIGGLVLELINTNINNGVGDESMYTSTGGILGDLDGDGFVSSSDLLEFLSGFGSGTTLTPNQVQVTRDAFDPDQDFGSSTEEVVTFTTSNLDSQQDTAAFSVSVTNGTGIIQISDGAGSGSFGGILLNAFNDKKIVIIGDSTVEVDTSAGLKTRLEVSIGAYNSSNQLITAGVNPYEELNVLSGSTFYEIGHGRW